jgi:hypothetical protein
VLVANAGGDRGRPMDTLAAIGVPIVTNPPKIHPVGATTNT